jgi:vibriolysin
MAVTVQLFVATSGAAEHPSVELNIPPQYKILGGGAFDHWSGTGNLLTASYPVSLQTWFAAGKDHEVVSPAAISAFALALFDPNDEWNVVIQAETSDPAEHPQAVAILPPGFTLTGGGAFVDYGGGAGNLLTASFPNSASSWEARSKDHLVVDEAKITAYAIGLQPRPGNNARLSNVIVNSTGLVAEHPSAQVCLDDAFTLSGGGAIDNWNEPGNLLTASFPMGGCWLAAGKDHIEVSPASITVYAIGIRTA